MHPSNRIYVHAEHEAAHTLRERCEQLNIHYTWDELVDSADEPEWRSCYAWITPEQHTLLQMCMPHEHPDSDWYSETFEESLGEQREIEYEYKVTNPPRDNPNSLREFIERELTSRLK